MNEMISSEITPEILRLTELCEKNNSIDPKLYEVHGVNRGLRDINGNGVVVGLSKIGEIRARETVNGKVVPSDGKLFYHGYNIKDLISGFERGQRFRFEETVYLLLLGELPNKQQLDDFKKLLASYHSIPESFVRDIIMKAPSKDMMNVLQRCVLTLYAYDDKANDISVPNVLRQCLQLIAQFPQLSVYGYQAFSYYHGGGSLVVHAPNPELSTAENILYMLRSDHQYTALEASLLDLALVTHAEHGGGNNSTFTTHVVTSTGSDTYSVIAAALGALKGPRHGGINTNVMKMMENIKANVKNLDDDSEIEAYLTDIINKKAFDGTGIIYGMGHAVYSVSDPRVKIFKSFVEKLAAEKHKEDESKLYSKVAELAPKVIARERKIYKGVSPAIDFYSGFVYQLLDLPIELYTPIFAIARIAGWSAHRIEELVNPAKVIRPAYKSVSEHKEYIPIEER